MQIHNSAMTVTKYQDSTRSKGILAFLLCLVVSLSFLFHPAITKGLYRIYRAIYWVYHFDVQTNPDWHVVTSRGRKEMTLYRSDLVDEPFVQALADGEYEVLRTIGYGYAKGRNRETRMIRIGSEKYILKDATDRFGFARLLSLCRGLRYWNHSTWMSQVTKISEPLFLSIQWGQNGVHSVLVLPYQGESIGTRANIHALDTARQLQDIEAELGSSKVCHSDVTLANLVRKEGVIRLIDLDDCCRFLPGAYLQQCGRKVDARGFSQVRAILDEGIPPQWIYEYEDE